MNKLTFRYPVIIDTPIATKLSIIIDLIYKKYNLLFKCAR